ncbi:hypothetical protein [Thiocystis violacea]|uniref:hypothetical protein n=1 Tax=Thiocystis violacea TaxID=13725 RepID=UPI001906C295|nr:hypothetical protein [Thiocystis violacea]MBK1720438.1 hypothetical protein [Thiocystis violacea]
MNQSRWINDLAALPYAQPLLAGWRGADHIQDPGWPDYERALDACLASQDPSLPLAQRYAALTDSRDRLLKLRASDDKAFSTRLLLSRVLHALNESQAAMEETRDLLHDASWLTMSLPADVRIVIDRPFLPPLPAQDHRPFAPERQTLGSWLQAVIHESLGQSPPDADSELTPASAAVECPTPPSSPRILHLSTLDCAGSGSAAHRLHQGLRKTGLDSSMCVLHKESTDPDVRWIHGVTGVDDPGDPIFLARYFRPLLARTDQLTIRSVPALASLLARSFPTTTIDVLEADTPMPVASYWVAAEALLRHLDIDA